MFLQPSQNKNWLLSEGGEISGPFSVERVRTLLEWGRASGEAYVCDESGSAWIPIRQSIFAPYVPAAEAADASGSRAADRTRSGAGGAQGLRFRTAVVLVSALVATLVLAALNAST